MQTFSSMQRNSSDIYFLKNIVFFITILFYQILSSIYVNLPPLIGLSFAYVVILAYEKDKSYQDYTHGWYQAILYLFIAEQMHGFELFSVAIAFVIFYYLFFEISLENIRLRNVFLVFLVTAGYVGTFFISNFISYLKDGHYMSFGVEYLTYIVVESALAILFLKGRIL